LNNGTYLEGPSLSFFLDPLALFILGMLLYHVSRRRRWSLQSTVIRGAVVSLLLFFGISSMLYMDLIPWPLPYREGSVWMFHTLITGIEKTDVPVPLVIFMFLLYPVWHTLGYIFALRQDIGAFILKTVTYEDVKSRKEKPVTDVSVRRGPSPSQITREAVEALGGMRSFVNEGDRVLIKPNICGGNPKIEGSYTSHGVVEELVKMVREVKAEPIVADADMIWTQFEPVAKEQGWIEWADRVNVPLINLAKTDRVFFDFGKDSTTGIVPVSKELVDADVIISVPTMKTHLLTSITIGMKNMYGTFPQENKAKFHRFGIEGVILDVNRAFTPTLTVIDGTIGGDAWGPLSCTPVYAQTVIASNDVVAADAVACQLMGYDPDKIVHLKRAHEEGLGDASIVYDLGTLPYEHPKDGDWTKPAPEVSLFYEKLIEHFLLLPGMQKFFDLTADYVLLGGATKPYLKDMTPELERVLDDILGMALRSGFRGTAWKEGDLERFKEKIEHDLRTEYNKIKNRIIEYHERG
jgi:uncharacterized protein (DUF362 family)